MKFTVWLRMKDENTHEYRWVEQGDGPMGPATAQRVAREIAHDFKIKTKVLPVGDCPPLLNDMQRSQ